MLSFTQNPILAIALGALSVSAYYEPAYQKKTTCPRNNTGTAKCTAADGKIYTALFPGNNFCWTGGSGIYKCKPYSEGGNCAPSAVDITSCKIKPPKCPPNNKPRTTCTASDGNKYHFNNPNPFPCWYKKGEDWECATREMKGRCPRGMLDTNKCPIEKPECPDENMPETSCYHKGALYTFGNPGDNLCWYKNGPDAYGCGPKKVDGSCNRGSIEILDCPIKQTKCPPIDKPATTCTNTLGGTTVFENTTAFPCWSKKNGSYFCSTYLGNGACKRHEVDASKCEIVYPITPCPKLYTNDVCTASDGKSIKITEMNIPGAPVCWSTFKPYSCIQPRMGSCPTGFANVGTCKIAKPYGGYNDYDS